MPQNITQVEWLLFILYKVTAMFDKRNILCPPVHANIIVKPLITAEVGYCESFALGSSHYYPLSLYFQIWQYLHNLCDRRRWNNEFIRKSPCYIFIPRPSTITGFMDENTERPGKYCSHLFHTLEKPWKKLDLTINIRSIATWSKYYIQTLDTFDYVIDYIRRYTKHNQQRPGGTWGKTIAIRECVSHVNQRYNKTQPIFPYCDRSLLGIIV